MTAVGCCGRRRDDGIVDHAAVLLAVSGQRTPLTPRERRVVIWRLTYGPKQWGPQRIADHLGCHKSLVTSILAEMRRAS